MSENDAMIHRARSWAAILLATCTALGAGAAACAQSSFNRDFGSGIIGRFDPAGDTKQVTITSQFSAPTAERPAVLAITARIAPDWHIYSITQPPGGPQATKIRLTPSPSYRQIGPFRAFPPPKSHVDEVVWKGLEIQEHEGEVTWYAPIAISVDVDPANLVIEGTVDLQVCTNMTETTRGVCIPLADKIEARLGESVPIGPLDTFGKPADATPLSEPTFSGSFQAPDSEVKLTGHLEPATVRPGESARLVITATPSPGWHMYAYSPYDNKPGSKPTLITFQSTSGLVPSQPKTDAPTKVDNAVPMFGPMRYHEGPVTWVTQIEVPASAPPGEYPIRGLIGYQACEYRADRPGSCELAHAVEFQGTLTVGNATGTDKAPLTFAAAKKYADAALLAGAWADVVEPPPPPAAPTGNQTVAGNDVPTVGPVDIYDLSRVRVEAETRSFGYYIALAFVGGLILNLMPCVLPVIGLKVMSFVQQAGHSRSHALVLNLWYALGIITVFVLLGVLAATIGLSWGAQFGNTTFNVIIASIVFAMALSLLGVWEVPIPGFFGRGAAQDLAAQEGSVGAYFKGMITTVLATPCGAPFMAPALFWATSQPFTTALVIFASVGIGMASPYLIVGMFPELLRFLPKPGPWMETFKQLSGFILLATVVFILFFMDSAAVVPTVLLFVGIGMACWLMSRVSLADLWQDQLQTYALSGAVILLFGVVSFAWLYPLMQPRFAGQVAKASADGEWQPFSLQELKRVAVDGRRTVLVDFSADWCASCKVFETTVLHSDPVEQAIADSGAATMYADFTDYPQEIKDTILALRSSGVPVIAVFPGDRPYEPIVFSGGYTRNGLIEALEKATGRRLRTEAVAEASTAAAPLN